MSNEGEPDVSTSQQPRVELPPDMLKVLRPYEAYVREQADQVGEEQSQDPLDFAALVDRRMRVARAAATSEVIAEIYLHYREATGIDNPDDA